MKEMIQALNKVKNTGECKDFLMRSTLEKSGYIKHLGYGKYTITKKAKRFV